MLNGISMLLFFFFVIFFPTRSAIRNQVSRTINHMVVGINLTPGRVIFLLSQNETVVRQLYNSTNNRPSVSITVIVITLSCLELYIMLRHIVRTTFHRQRERASSALLFQLDNLVHNTSSRSDINFIEKRTE